MIYIIMGVSGSGKSTIGKRLADKLDCAFYDGDDFHPEANLVKMSEGIPLDDDDRYPWLIILNEQLRQWELEGDVVIACSALKESYRDILQSHSGKVQWIYLQGDYDLILGRMRLRKDHFMKPDMLKSQFDSLEEPNYGWHIDISHIEDKCVNQIVSLIDAARIEN